MCNCNYSYKGFNFKHGYRPVTENTVNRIQKLAKYLNCNAVTFCEVETKGIHFKTQFQRNSNRGSNRANCGCTAKGSYFGNDEK